MDAPRRPALRYMGGKWRLAPWIIEHFPPHAIYVEPYGGAASVLLRKERAKTEIYNDLDNQVINLFRMLRHPEYSKRLIELVALTPFARVEFDLTYEISDDPIEAARRLIARSFMGHGSTAVALRRRTGFRSDNRRAGKHPAGDWAGLPPALQAITERLKGVVIENHPALAVIERFDSAETLVYCDPPYVHHTRSQKRINGSLEHAYVHEMDEAQHLELLTFLADCKSYVVLSGYRCPLYDAALGAWQRYETLAYADGAKPRTEALWLNPRAAEWFERRRQLDMPLASASA